MTTLPSLACDCHTHVFPPDYAFSPARRYTPPYATLAQLQSLHAAIGIERVVIVQPSVYGTDNTATQDAIAMLGLDRARGVAVIDADISEAALHRLHVAGFRGVRVNLDAATAHSVDHPLDRLAAVADRIALLGWHLQIFAPISTLAQYARALHDLPGTLVLDHFAGVDARESGFESELDSVLPLVANGKAYVKISAAYRGFDSMHDPRLATTLRTLLSCNADRLVWGSDWPHPNPASPKAADGTQANHVVDLQQAVSTVVHACGSAEIVQKIFCDNPARLYDFESATE